MTDEINPERLVLKAADGSCPQVRAEEGRSSAFAMADGARSRRAYGPPELESLGRFRALTLQQSVPIGPGG